MDDPDNVRPIIKSPIKTIEIFLASAPIISTDTLGQGSSITFSREPKAQKIGKVAGHRLKTQLKNRIY